MMSLFVSFPLRSEILVEKLSIFLRDEYLAPMCRDDLIGAYQPDLMMRSALSIQYKRDTVRIR